MTAADPDLAWQPTYLDHAHDGISDKGTYRKGQLLVGVIWLVSSLALVKLVIWGSVEIAKSSDPVGLLRAVQQSDHAPWPWLGFLAALIGFIPLAIILPVLIQRIHHRSWRVSVTPFARLDWRQMARGAALWAVVYAAIVAVTALVQRGSLQAEFELGDFLPGLIVLLLLVPVQAFGQELFFRGYGLQFASLDVRSPRALAVISGLAFGVPFLFAPWIVEWIVPEVQVPDIPLLERAILMSGYVLLGAALASVSIRTGTVELAMGAAFANNLTTGLLLSPNAGSLAGGSVLEIRSGIWQSLVYTILLAAGLWAFVRLSGRFVPDPTTRIVMDHSGHTIAGSRLQLPTGSAMWRVSLRSVLAHRLRLILTVMSIALGVSFVVGTIVFADTTNRALSRFFDNEPADVVVRPIDPVTVAGQGGAPPALTMPASVLDRVSGVAGVAAADPQVQQEGVLILDSDGEPVGGASSAHVGVSWHLPESLDQVDPDVPALTFDGELPRGIGEVALDTATAERTGTRIGDVIHLATPLRTDRDQPWRVTGIVDIGLSGGATVAVFDLPTAQQVITGAGRVNQVLVTADAGVSAGTVTQAINSSLGADSPVQAITGRQAADQAQNRVADALSFLNTLMVVFACIALLMSTFLIFNTFAMLVAQRTRELALVRAVGAARQQLQGSVLLQALALGTMGTVLGVAGGVALSFGLRRLLAAFDIEVPTGGLVIAPRMLVVACVAGIGVTILAALAPALRAARVPPVQAMQMEPSPARGAASRRVLLGAILLALAAGTAILAFRDSTAGTAVAWMGLSALLAIATFVALAPMLAAPVLRVLGLPFRSAMGRLAEANSRRNRRRTTATAAALTIGVALMTIVTVLATSTTATADGEIDRAIGADLSVGAPPLYRSFDHAITREIQGLAGVQDVTFVRTTAGQRGELPVPVFGVEPDRIRQGINLDVVAGDLADVGGDAIAVDTRLAQQYRIGIGDTFPGTFRTGRQTFRVAALFEPIIVYQGILTDLATAQRLGAPAGQDAVAYITLAPGADAAAVRDQVAGVAARNPALQVQDATVLKEDFRSQINRLIGFVFAMLALAVLIGVLGIVNTLLLAVHERTAELGVLRAVGATQSQVRRLVVIEAALVGLFGAVTGVVLGVVYGAFLQIVMAPLGITRLDIPWPYLAVFVAAGAVAGVLAALWPAVAASRLNILRAIASE